MPLTIVFSPGDRSQVVQIPLVCDEIVESTETFSMSLSVNVTNPRLQVGAQRTATGNIEDSTGKRFIITSIYNVCHAFICSNR